jgi:D-alanine-D-alanine ligase
MLPEDSNNIPWKTLSVCVLQPDYSTSAVDYQNYDPPRDLSQLMPEAQFTHVLLNKLTTYKQLKELKKKNFAIFVNLCEGYLEWEVPSIDVPYTLELLNLPFTGPSALLYDPPKELMKYVAFCEGIKTPAYVLIENVNDVDTCDHLHYPLFVKPAKAGDSLGIDEYSLVFDKVSLQKKVEAIIGEFDALLVEEYIDGREFTVLVMAGPDGKTAKALRPVEYIFPEENRFKTYQLKTSALHPEANIPVTDIALDLLLRDAAEKIFKGFNGAGYSRLDFRMDKNGDLFFLEINFTCSVFYTNGYEGSADYILTYDGIGQSGFLRHIIAEGIARHQNKQKLYKVKGNSIAGYGIYATRNIAAKEVVFTGEGRSQRIITRRFVEQNWNEQEKDTFRRYAYPMSRDLFLLWDDDPSEWAPQNHCCKPNTAYNGLNVIALQNIVQGEELTLDYAAFLDENMEPFHCKCGIPGCRGLITGQLKNSLTERENQQGF